MGPVELEFTGGYQLPRECQELSLLDEAASARNHQAVSPAPPAAILGLDIQNYGEASFCCVTSSLWHFTPAEGEGTRSRPENDTFRP